MKRLAALAVALSLLASAGAHANPGELRIARAGSQPPGRGPAEYFTGSVRVDPLFPATAPSRMSGGLVTFEPGGRSAWHTHPVGQVLIVTAGLG
jgi:4-carboxymuconolactone decarboxylase